MPKPHDDADDADKGLAAYAGRWIARLWNRVVGQGGTPQQAQQAAISARHKETPQVSFVPTSSPLTFSPILDDVSQALPKKTVIYLVGGAVRDAFLKKESHDLDFALPRNALKVARKAANALQGAYYRMDDEHQTGRVVLVADDGTRTTMDFAAMGSPDLEEDLRKRDFTINAMAVDVHQPQELLDPLGGLTDLLNKRLRVCSPTAFLDDPVRVLRAIRMAAGFSLTMVSETRQLIKQAVDSLPMVSPERVRDELFKIFDGPQPATSIRALEMVGALEHVLPEIIATKGVSQSPPHIYDVWEHTLHTLQRLDVVLSLLDEGYSHDNESGGDITSGLISLRLGRYRKQVTQHFNTSLSIERSSRALLFLAALYHDAGKPECRIVEEDGRIRFTGHEEGGAKMAADRGTAFHLSNAEIDRIKVIVRNHMRPWHLAKEEKPPSRRAIYRFFRDTQEAGVDICLLDLADIMAIYDPTSLQEELPKHLEIVRTLLEAYWEQKEEIIYPPALVDGNDLMRKLKLRPGPKIGELLEAIREAQAMGEVKTKGDALEFGERWLEGKD